MRRRQLFLHLFLTFLTIILLTLIPLGWYANKTLSTFYIRELKERLQARCALVSLEIERYLHASDAWQLDQFCKSIGKTIGNRVTVVLPSGQVIGDSEEDPSLMDNHKDRPEVQDALLGRTGTEIRYSPTLKREMVYVATPLFQSGRIVAVVRTSVSLRSVQETLQTISNRFFLGGLVAAMLAATLSLILSRHISAPLIELRRGAELFARGELQRRIHTTGYSETRALADAMNQMAAQLNDRIQTVVRHRSELEAVLSSMAEGVLAVDTDERIISMNQAAAQLVGAQQASHENKTIQEVIRIPDLQRFVTRALSSASPIEGEILIGAETERVLLARGTLLRDATDNAVGAVIVFSDVTRLRRLENMRRDFVANVSHELRTPVTSIKGFVETLIDGAVNNPEDAQRFLGIISRHADRLNAIIEDLLTLSRIEQEARRADIERDNCQLRPILASALEVCSHRAIEKAIQFELFCDETLQAQVNAPLLEQAIINLVDNAIKYSPNDSIIKIDACQNEAGFAISVADSGCGIPPEHLPRLFERFYRVDKARSRTLGGTGLGLAIVKHIAQAHQGTVTVESEVGKGSRFTIHLPRVF